MKLQMAKFRKKPVVIEAVRAHMLIYAAEQNWKELPSWIKEAYEAGDVLFSHQYIQIRTTEGTMTANSDDWVILGVNGELYPCKPDVFEKTYEAV